MTTITKEFSKKETINISGAEAVIRSLIDEGITTIFGYPGGAIMPVYDALYDFSEKLNHVLVRHEQGAIHAAEGYARVSGKTGVCLVTSGPGATNLVTGLADAMADSTPLVCITGQVASPLLGTDAFQETDIIGITTAVTKWNFLISSPEEIPSVLSKAFFIANSGRPGPVLIDITKDAQFKKLNYSYQKHKYIPHYITKPVLPIAEIKQAANLINAAKAPLLLIGQGILLSGAEKQLLQFADKTGIPVASTLLGLSAFPANHPLYMGMLGMHGNYAPNMLTNQCDLLIAIGMRFDDRVTGDLNKYAKQAQIIHIDIDASELNKVVQTDIAIHADANDALIALFELMKAKSYVTWLQKFEKLKREETNEVIKKNVSNCDGPIKMAEVIHQISLLTNGNAIVVTDVGQHQMIASRYYNFNSPLSNVTSGGLGTMGFALPAAIGAKLAQPNREVIAIIGDGGFQMTLQELGTILQYNMPVKIIILNNNFLGMVRQWQQLFFHKRYAFTEMINPDFVAIGKAYKIESKKVEQRDELNQALQAMVDSKESCLLEIIVEKEDNVFPMIPTGAGVDEVILKSYNN